MKYNKVTVNLTMLNTGALNENILSGSTNLSDNLNMSSPSVRKAFFDISGRGNFRDDGSIISVNKDGLRAS
jgi:hypothetical protein